MSRALIIAALALALGGCAGWNTPPAARVVYTSQDGIAMQPPGGAVHFYRFGNKRDK